MTTNCKPLSIDEFTPDEFALLAAFVAETSLDEVAWLERVLANRLFATPPTAAQLAKVGLALAIGAGRSARFEKLSKAKGAQ